MGDKASTRRRVPYARQCIDQSDIDAVVETLQSDFVTQGPRIESFEEGLKAVSGAAHAVVVSSGTAALHVAYAALGIGTGDIGIVPAITFAATANALKYCGADPVFCDVDPDSGLARPADFANAIERLGSDGKSTKVLAPVSYSGRLCDLKAISKIARNAGAFVVEDAAHSLGASRDGTVSGSCRYSDAAILSFHPVKHICAGEGGAVLTNDETVARRARSLRSHGIVKEPTLTRSEGGWAYAQEALGWNYRMTDLQASLGESQLKRLDAFVESRRDRARRYDEAFRADLFGHCFERPYFDPQSSWHLYVVRFRDSDLRRRAYEWLQNEGIGVQVHYRPVYRHPYYERLGEGPLPGAESFYERCLSLPLYPSLADSDQIRVIAVLEEFCQTV